MNLASLFGRINRHHWTKRIAAALAVLLLLPVPGFALSWVGGWSIVATVTGGAPVPIATTWDEGLKSFVMVNMGDTSANKTVASSALITMERKFLVTTTGGEQFALARVLKSQLAFAGYKITASIGHYDGAIFRTDFAYRNLSGRMITGQPFISKFENRSTPQVSPVLAKLSKNYVLRYTIYYDRQVGGYWKDYAPSAVGTSYHRFEFSLV
jgi:hypothetical protein